MKKAGDKPALILALMLLAGAASGAARATAPGGANVQPAASGLQASVDNKMRLVKLLLDQSPAVHRIPQSGNAQARSMLAEAQAAYARAGGEAQGGRLDAAARLLDEALRQIVAASRLVPDPGQVAAQERARYAQLSEAVRSFQSLYRKVSERGAKNMQAAAFAPDLDRIGALLDKAAASAAGGNHKEANAQLTDAYKIVVSMLNRALASETIVYDAKFDTPAEEFSYELARNGSYDELIPIALGQLHTAPETAALSERYAQQSRQLREVARQQAGGGDYRAALKTILEATGHLQRALRAAGLVVPQAEVKQ